MSDDMDSRELTMQRDILMVATAGASLLNGQAFSPVFDPVFFLLKPFLAAAFYSLPMVAFYLTSIFISLVTLMIAGIPAALYERAKGLKESSPISLGIWLAATIALVSLPYLMRA
ncbi:MAG TPA: hypothetical protein PK264_17860 [Hyphomicrobiaceae bacterium]|nr:hypothetical protein [Hyphomicrobiaceae bacterium]